MTTSSTPEDTIAECKRRVDECYALSETTIVPEYRQALSAMAKAWMKIAQSEQARIGSNQEATPDRLRVSSKSTPELSNRNLRNVKAKQKHYGATASARASAGRLLVGIFGIRSPLEEFGPHIH
jgi:hypothetical protein